jgi:uncharacterized membrane protein YccC
VLGKIASALAAELRSLEWSGARGLEAAEATAAVTLATLAALALHSDNPWWAAISAFQVTRASPAVALSRGIDRVGGSVLGAAAALLALGLFVYQSLPFLLCLFVFAAAGAIGFVSSRHGYAWLIGSVTASLIMLVCFDAPHGTFAIAVNRVIDVIIGSSAALLVSLLSPAPAGGPLAAAPVLDPPPLAVWRRDYGVRLRRWLPGNRTLLVNACRGGLTVMMMPWLANWIAPITPVAMGITVVMVLSLPTTAILNSDHRAIVERAVHRVVGCLLGVLVALALFLLIGQNFLLWLVLLAGGIWLCSQIQTGSAGATYIGTQAMFAYVTSMVQGPSPPTSLAPGFERLVGIMGGLSMLFVVTLALSLIPLAPAPAATAGD